MSDDGLLGLLADRGIRLKSLAPNFNGHVVCGRCGGGKTREVSLSVTIDEDGQGATWICHRGGCGWKDGVRVAQDRATGRPRDADRPTQRPAPHSPQQAANRPQWLWDFFSERAIGAKVVQDFGIYAMRRRFADPVGESDCIVFPYVWKGNLENRKFRPFPAKNPMLQDKGARPTLYNADSLGGEEVVFVEGECFPPETTVLTPAGWTPIRALNDADLVAQWEDGTVSFVRPLAYVKKPFSGDLVQLRGKGYAAEMTPGHRIIRRTRAGGFVPDIQANEFRNDSRYVIPRAGVCAGSGIPLTDDQIRLAVAVSADAAIDDRKGGGAVKPKEARYARFGLKRQRKIDRLRMLLLACALKSSDTEIKDSYRSICFAIPAWVPGRLLPWSWVAEATPYQRRLILNELTQWDGNRVPNRNQTEFVTKYAELAAWVQALAHTSGFCSTIMRRQNQWGEWLKVSLLWGKSHTGMQHLRATKREFVGDVWCVRVPSGALLIRHEERVSVSGNCDVLALAECGIRNAVSLKDGAPAQAGGDGQKRFDALATHQDELEKAKKIILAGDMDAPGLALREELSRRLGRHRCWTVQWPEGCKDAGDVLRLVGPDAVLAALAAAVPWPIEGLRYVTPTTLLELRRQPAPTTMSTGTRASDEVLRLPTEGRLIIVTGVPAAGKTSWIRFVMVHTAKDHDRRWCVFSPESQPWGQFVAQCAEAYSGKPFYYEPGIECMSDAETVEASTWLSRKMMMLLCDAEDEMPTPDWLLDRAKASLLRFGTTDLVLDPWNEITQARGAMSETDYTGMVLQRLRAFAQRYGVNVWIVVHPAKPPPLRAGEKRTVIGPYDLAGSAHFANKSDLGITVHSPLAGEAELHIWKSRSRRWAVRGKKCKLDYDALVGRYSTPISQLASPDPMPAKTRRDLF